MHVMSLSTEFCGAPGDTSSLSYKDRDTWIFKKVKVERLPNGKKGSLTILVKICSWDECLLVA